MIATKDLRALRRQGQSGSSIVIIKRLKDSSVVVLPIIALFAAISYTDVIFPPIPLVLIALCTYLTVDRLMIRVQQRILLRKMK